MLSEEQIRERLKSFLEGNESLDSLEDWLALESFASIQRDGDPVLKNLVAGVMHSLDFYSDKQIDEASLKAELRAFAEPNEIREQEIQIAFSNQIARESIKRVTSVNSSVQHLYA